MINVSQEFRDLMQVRTDFKQNAEVTLADGTALTLGESDFTVTNNSISDAAGANALPLGVAIVRSVQMELINDDGHLSGYDFFGATIRLYLTFQLSATVEKIEMGVFTVDTPETYGETVIVTASDDMHKADRSYATELSYPASAQAVLKEACERCGIALYSTDFLNSDFQVQAAPDKDLTYRQIIGYVAMIACGNARINRSGYLEIIPYDFDKNRHDLKGWKNLRMDSSDITITGIQTSRVIEVETGTANESILSGSEGYVISVDNPLAVGKEADLIAYIAGQLVGVSMRPFEGDHIANPLVEFMDLADIYDRKGNAYRTVITDVNFSFFGFTNLKNSAESAFRVNSQYASPTSAAIVAARKLVQQETSQREIAIQKLNETLANASGMYVTEEIQPDGSKISYLHDKPTLAESQNVIKVTADAIGLSTDGGASYPYGVTVDGETIMRIISAQGINAEWVKIEDKSVDGVIATLQSDIDGVVSKVASQSQEMDNLRTDIAAVQVLSGEVAIQIQSILENGVDKVKTTMGYTFNDDGMRIKKSGEEIENRLDHTGMYVSRTDENVLTANADGVNAININVRQYLSVGHSRLERFTRGSDAKRTACFYVGEVV